MSCTQTAYYPVMLQLKGRSCFVIGGGIVATRKINGLLQGGADQIIVISPSITNSLEKLVKAEQLEWIQQQYDELHIKEAFLVFAATDNVELNDRISGIMERKGILVCNVSNGLSGSFITPAVIYEAGMTVAVSTGGEYPALTRKIKEDIYEHITSKYTVSLAQLSSIRAKIIERVSVMQLKNAMLALALEDCLEQREIKENDWYDSLLERCTLQQGFSTILKDEG